MDRAEWQERAHGGQLAGMTLATFGDYPDSGGWEVYVIPDQPKAAARFRTWPPHPGFGGMISLGRFSATETISMWSATGYSPDRLRAHRAFAVGATAGATVVRITDLNGVTFELTHAGTHPDGRTELFVGGTTALALPAKVEAFGVDGTLLAHSGSLAERGIASSYPADAGPKEPTD